MHLLLDTSSLLLKKAGKAFTVYPTYITFSSFQQIHEHRVSLGANLRPTNFARSDLENRNIWLVFLDSWKSQLGPILLSQKAAPSKISRERKEKVKAFCSSKRTLGAENKKKEDQNRGKEQQRNRNKEWEKDRSITGWTTRLFHSRMASSPERQRNKWATFYKSNLRNSLFFISLTFPPLSASSSCNLNCWISICFSTSS